MRSRGSKPSRALNCGLDNVLDGEAHAKPHCPGAVEAFRVARPAPLWAMMHQRFAMTVGALMAIGSAVLIRPSIAPPAPPAPPPVFGVLDQGAAGNWFDQLAAAMVAHDEGIVSHSLDPCFSRQENHIAMTVQLAHAASLRGVERTVDVALQRFGLSAADMHLSMSGGCA
jgi:hypothetical protein